MTSCCSDRHRGWSTTSFAVPSAGSRTRIKGGGRRQHTVLPLALSLMPAPPLKSFPPLVDRVAPDVRVLFVGINPGVRSAMTGHHFAGYSNRFWKLLFESGLVPERITF